MGKKIRLTEDQLRKVIRESVWYPSTDNAILSFGQAWKGLGDAVTSQVVEVVEAYFNTGGVGNPSGHDTFIETVTTHASHGALELAKDRLGYPLSDMANEDAEEIIRAIDEALEVFEKLSSYK